MKGKKKGEGGERKKDREGGKDRDWWGEEERGSESEHPRRPEGWGKDVSLPGRSFADAGCETPSPWTTLLLCKALGWELVRGYGRCPLKFMLGNLIPKATVLGMGPLGKC